EGAREEDRVMGCGGVRRGGRGRCSARRLPTEGDTASASPSARASVPPSTTRFVSGIPMPDGQQTEDLLYGLRRIHPALDRARSIDRARNVCRQILDDMPREKVIEG